MTFGSVFSDVSCGRGGRASACMIAFDKEGVVAIPRRQLLCIHRIEALRLASPQCGLNPQVVRTRTACLSLYFFEDQSTSAPPYMAMCMICLSVTERSQKCSCGAWRFCSKACQVQHWPQHKEECSIRPVYQQVRLACAAARMDLPANCIHTIVSFRFERCTAYRRPIVRRLPCQPHDEAGIRPVGQAAQVDGVGRQ